MKAIGYCSRNRFISFNIRVSSATWKQHFAKAFQSSNKLNQLQPGNTTSQFESFSRKCNKRDRAQPRPPVTSDCRKYRRLLYQMCCFGVAVATKFNNTKTVSIASFRRTTFIKASARHRRSVYN